MSRLESMEARVIQKLRLAKVASQTLQTLEATAKEDALEQIADAVWTRRSDILEANTQDVNQFIERHRQDARVDRLRLTEQRIAQMVTGLRDVAALPDPVGDVMDARVLQSGVHVSKIRVPFGVIAIIYESRPNVTVDATALTLKTSNAVVLRGGSDAMQTNQTLVGVIRDALRETSMPVDAVQFIDEPDHASVDVLIGARGFVDLAIPRGGAALIERVVKGAKVPVIETGVGNCHLYIDEDADPLKALDILMNAKTQRPTVCNAVETLLVHERIAATWLPDALEALHLAGVTVRGCDKTLKLVSNRETVTHVQRATEADWSTEYLALVLAVRVVADFDEAMAHIRRYSTNHSEAIVTDNVSTADRFLRSVDAAVVYHNASTRFTDGFEFGFGAEIGISTQKLHARGPMGLTELTSYQYVVRGNGHIRS